MEEVFQDRYFYIHLNFKEHYKYFIKACEYEGALTSFMYISKVLSSECNPVQFYL